MSQTESHAAAPAQLGQITKTCETTKRAEHYTKLVTQVKTLRLDPKKFDLWYKNTYERAFGLPGKSGLNTLRDLGTYDPDPAKNQQKSITSAADARKKGTPLKKLTKTATAEQFAEQLSIVHPSNNAVFTEVTKCVHEGRGANQTEVVVESVPETAPPPLHTFTQSDLDASLAGIPQQSTDNLDLDDDLLLEENSDMDINLGGTLVPVY